MSVRIGHSPTGVHVTITDEDEFRPPVHRGKFRKYQVIFHQDYYILSPSTTGRKGFSMTKLPNGTFKLVARDVLVMQPFSNQMDVLYFRRQTPCRVVFDNHGEVAIYPDYVDSKPLKRNGAEERKGVAPPHGVPRAELRAFDNKEQMEAHSRKVPGPVVTVSTTKHYHLQLDRYQLIEWMNGDGPTGHKLPPTARIWVDIPGGCDFSSQPLDLTGESMLNITWEDSE